MVSFSCEGCGDVLTKKKLDQHRNRCHGASFTCIDCMVDFHGTTYRSHTSCMTEAQKYQGALYQVKKDKGNTSKNSSQALVPQLQAYVEDAEDEYTRRPYSVDSPEEYHDNLPAAPSPPSAVPDFDSEEPVNVFDFLDNSQTPNASRFDLSASEPTPMVEDTPQDGRAIQFHHGEYNESAIVPYTNGLSQENAFETPMPAVRSKREPRPSDRKRKHLHVETQDLDTSPARDTEDALMTDAPPVLHSGLTGGLKGLLARPSVFPPSPDYSGDAAEPDPSPGSPLKKTKHAKTSSSRRKVGRGESLGNNLMSLITTGSLTHKHADDLPRKKKSSTKDKKSSAKTKTKPKTRATSKPFRAIEPAAQKLLEYKPTAPGQVAGGGVDVDEDTKMVLYQARAELFMSFVNKGPESERGCSMNKALKRYHRECEGLGISIGKSGEEKELWRSLRLKKNDRGEVVVFF